MITGIKILRPKKGKPKSIGNITFLFSLERRRIARLLKFYYFIFRIGPGVGADQEPGVGVGVGTAPPRLRTPSLECACPHKKSVGVTFWGSLTFAKLTSILIHHQITRKRYGGPERELREHCMNEPASRAYCHRGAVSLPDVRMRACCNIHSYLLTQVGTVRHVKLL